MELSTYHFLAISCLIKLWEQLDLVILFNGNNLLKRQTRAVFDICNACEI